MIPHQDAWKKMCYNAQMLLHPWEVDEHICNHVEMEVLKLHKLTVAASCISKEKEEMLKISSMCI